MNKSIKETENLTFFSVGLNLISFINTKTCIFTINFNYSENTSFGEKV